MLTYTIEMIFTQLTFFEKLFLCQFIRIQFDESKFIATFNANQFTFHRKNCNGLFCADL